MKSQDVFKTLQNNHRGVCGVYSDDDHELTVFVATTGHTWDTWKNTAEKVRREATMRPSTVGGIWLRDPSAPRLNMYPTFAAVFDRKAGVFVPAINTRVHTLQVFCKALEQAENLVGACTAFHSKTGRHPTRNDVLSDGMVLYGDGGSNGAVQDLLAFVNK